MSRLARNRGRIEKTWPRWTRQDTVRCVTKDTTVPTAANGGRPVWLAFSDRLSRDISRLTDSSISRLMSVRLSAPPMANEENHEPVFEEQIAQIIAELDFIYEHGTN